MIVIGWDVSTSAIGICVKRDGKPNLYHVIFPEGKTHLEKHRSATEQIKEWLAESDDWGPVVPTHIVEDRLGGFSGMTTKQTLMALAAMNAVVSMTLSYTGKVIHIPPVTTKRITGLFVDKENGEDKKIAVVKLARSSDPNFPYKEKKAPKKKPTGKYYPWIVGVDDMADAWLLAEAGTLVLQGKASVGPAKKAPKRKSKTGRAKDTEGV
jgi:hypothetical protein